MEDDPPLQPRVAHEPPHRRAWVAHTYDCQACGYWAYFGDGQRCAIGRRLYAASAAHSVTSAVQVTPAAIDVAD